MLQEFKNGELFAMREQLPALLDLAVPARIQLKLVRLAKGIAAKSDDIAEVRNKLVRLYGEDTGHGNFHLTGPNSEGKPISPDWDKFAEEINDLMAQTTQLEFEKIMLPADLAISGKLLLAFEAFLDVAEEEPVRDGQGKEPIPMRERAT